MRDLSTSGKRQVTSILLPLFGPLARCPGCGTPLDGGPVLYRCQACRRAVPGSRRGHRVPRPCAEGGLMRLVGRRAGRAAGGDRRGVRLLYHECGRPGVYRLPGQRRRASAGATTIPRWSPRCGIS